MSFNSSKPSAITVTQDVDNVDSIALDNLTVDEGRGVGVVPQKSQDDDNCVLCDNEIEIFATGPCRHHICYVCSAKMRVVCQQMYCAICRCYLDKVYLTHRRILHASELSQNAEFNEHGFSFGGNKQIEDQFNNLFANKCPICMAIYDNFEDLSEHARKIHRVIYCSVCFESLRLFPFERKFYTNEAYVDHCLDGDYMDGAFTGHPICRFCKQRFFDKDALYRHSISEHFYCSFCTDEGRIIFYREYAELRGHFRRYHYLCEHEDCLALELSSNVFRSEIELSAHVLEAHSSGSKQARRLARIVPSTSIFTAEPDNERPRGRQGQRGNYHSTEGSSRSNQRASGSNLNYAASGDAGNDTVFGGLTEENFPSLNPLPLDNTRSTSNPQGGDYSDYVSNWLQNCLPEIDSTRTSSKDSAGSDKVTLQEGQGDQPVKQSISYRGAVGAPWGDSRRNRIELGETEFPSLPANPRVRRTDALSKQSGIKANERLALEGLRGIDQCPPRPMGRSIWTDPHRLLRPRRDNQPVEKTKSNVALTERTSFRSKEKEQTLPSIEDFPQLSATLNPLKNKQPALMKSNNFSSLTPYNLRDVSTLHQVAQRSFKTLTTEGSFEKTRVADSVKKTADQHTDTSEWPCLPGRSSNVSPSRQQLRPGTSFASLAGLHQPAGRQVIASDTKASKEGTPQPVIVPAYFIPPADYNKRKLVLASKIRDLVGDNEVLFRSINKSYINYCTNRMGVVDFYNALCKCVGINKLSDFVYMLIPLLPDVRKQRELYSTIRRSLLATSRKERIAMRARSITNGWCVEPLQTCTACGQLVDGFNDLSYHRDQHLNLPTMRPTVEWTHPFLSLDGGIG